MQRIAALVLIFAVILFAGARQSLAAKRVALVVGNAAYTHATPLKNPVNDASDMAATLKSLGFEVISGTDLDKRALVERIRAFTSSLAAADVGLFFYAGHGLQVAGQNYIAPVDARLSQEGDLDFETVPIDLVLRQMEREAKINLVFLDACRDNPLARNLARSMGTRSASVGSGLARIESGVGTLIAFATQPGNVALDGEGRNSPFTAALLRHIASPGIDINRMMIGVRRSVIDATAGKQVPWEHSSLTAAFMFRPGQPGAAPVAAGDAEVEGLRARLRQLEDQLTQQAAAPAAPAPEAKESENKAESGEIAALREQIEALTKTLSAQSGERGTDPAYQQQAALTPPAIAPLPGGGPHDGVWRIDRSSPNCRVKAKTWQVTIEKGKISWGNGSGTVDADGTFRWKSNLRLGNMAEGSGKIEGEAGKGTVIGRNLASGKSCAGTITLTRVSR